jgi:phosphoglycerol transferase MdoB-like AlkP superfamily enzyme
LISVSLGAQTDKSQGNDTLKLLIDKILNPTNPNFISAGYILWFGGFIIGLISLLSWLKWDTDRAVRLFGLMTIVILLIFVSVIGVANESLTALIGILGTYGGYLAGNTQGQQGQQQNSVKEFNHLLDEMLNAGTISQEDHNKVKAILPKKN